MARRLCPAHQHLRCPVCNYPTTGALGALARFGKALRNLGCLVIVLAVLIGALAAIVAAII